MSNNRPRSRKQGEATSRSDVNKRGSAGTPRTGNQSYDRKPVSGGSHSGQTNKRPDHTPGYDRIDRFDGGDRGPVRGPVRTGNYYTGAPVRRRNPFFRILLFLLIAVLLVSCLRQAFSSMGTIDQPQPADTPAPVQQTAAATYNPPTTTYTDTTMPAVDATVAEGIRDRYTTILGNGQDSVTILVYMIASDLESGYGMATNDINEMAYAAHSDNVRVVLQTGGTKRWRNNVMKTGTNERWQVTDRSVVALDRAVGNKRMTDPATLADFIQWGTKKYPANRYMLILWDHGGGSVSGYGYDQVYPNTTMTLDKLAQALEAGGVKFDFIGFDACLMGNTETALVCSKYADWLIASEETEPGTGWYYTDWLTSLAQNPSLPTLEIGKQIIDGFVVQSARSGRREKTSLSIIDLAEFQAYVPAKLRAFAGDVTAALQTSQYGQIANARSVTKEFAQSNKLDQIDVVHFCENIGTASALELAEAVKSCVKYNRVNNMTNAYGLSIYFPYRTTNKVNAVAQLYNNIGMEEAYTDAVRSFATMEGSGQIYSNQTQNSLFDMLGGSPSSNGQTYDVDEFLNLLLGGAQQQPQQQEYNPVDDMLTLLQLLGGYRAIDSGSLENYASQIDRAHVDNAALEYSEINGHKVLSLDEEQWSLINRLALNVWVDDGEGFIDLGVDNVFSFDDDGNLLAEYDNTWVAVNDHVAAYYVDKEEYPSDEAYIIEGYIPVMLNGERANLIVQFTDEDIYGTILGAQKIYEEDVEAKGLVEIKAGDEIDFLCDYYDYNGNFEEVHYLKGTLVVGEEGVSMGVTELDADVLYSYVLTDIYNAQHWTPMLRN